MKKPFALLWIFVGGILVFSWGYLPTLSKYRDLKLQQDELDKQITKLTTDIEDVRKERDLLKNDVEYLEKVIRGELGLVKPGEIVYKFVQDKAGASTAAPGAGSAAPAAVNPLPPLAESKTAAQPSAEAEKKKEAAGEVFEAKPVAAKTKTSAAASVKKKTSAMQKPALKKPKVLPPADQEPAYPRRETR